MKMLYALPVVLESLFVFWLERELRERERNSRKHDVSVAGNSDHKFGANPRHFLEIPVGSL